MPGRRRHGARHGGPAIGIVFSLGPQELCCDEAETASLDRPLEAIQVGPRFSL